MSWRSIPLGIVVGLLASCVQSLGLTIQRKSHVLNQRLPPEQQQVEHRRPLWLLGIAIFLSSNILGSLVQIASLPVVILAPLGAVSLLFNALFACILLGDVFSPMLILGTVFIASGAVLIAVFGIVPEPTRSLEDLLRLFSRPTFVAYFTVLGAVVALCLITTHVVEYSVFKHMSAEIPSASPSPPQSPLSNPAHPVTLTTGVTDTITGSLTTERTPLLDRKPLHSSTSSSSISISRPSSPLSPAASKRANRTRLMLALSYSSISGLLSGMCLLFAKSGVELLLFTLNGDNQFWRWQAWALLLGLVIFALAQLWYLHKALVLADPTIVCPSAFCFYNLSSIVNGLVYFDQFALISPLHLGLVAIGIVVLLAGVWIVSVHSESSDTEDEAEDEETSALLEQDIESTVPGPLLSSPEMEDGEGDEFNWNRASRLSQSESSIHPQVAHLPQHQRTTSLSQRRMTYSASHPRGTLYLSPPLAASTSRGPSTDGAPLSPSIGGFQIGLSPISPGFAIRGRKTSTAESRAGTKGRRTLSEDLGESNESFGAVGEVPPGISNQPIRPRIGLGLGRWPRRKGLDDGRSRTVSEGTGRVGLEMNDGREVGDGGSSEGNDRRQWAWRWMRRFSRGYADMK